MNRAAHLDHAPRGLHEAGQLGDAAVAGFGLQNVQDAARVRSASEQGEQQEGQRLCFGLFHRGSPACGVMRRRVRPAAPTRNAKFCEVLG